MPQRDGGNGEREGCREGKDHNTANQTISEMAAGGTTSNNSLDAHCFRLIRQLLPTFSRLGLLHSTKTRGYTSGATVPL